MTDEAIATAIGAAPRPECRDILGEICPGPFERTASSSRPGELDVSVRCRTCHACAHHVFDADTGELLDEERLAEKRSRELEGLAGLGDLLAMPIDRLNIKGSDQSDQPPCE